MLMLEQRRKVIEIAQKAHRESLLKLTMGNFSLRDDESGLVCITPSGMEYATLNPEDIVIMDTHGNIIDGSRKPSIEWYMHCTIYQRRPDLFGVVHTHSTFSTAWACCGMGIPVVVAELAALVGGPVPCAPYKPMGTPELAYAVADTLKDLYAVLLGNHGMLAVGPTIDIAYNNALMVEEGAKIAYYAKQIGEMSIISEEHCKDINQKTMEKYGQK